MRSMTAISDDDAAEDDQIINNAIYLIRNFVVNARSNQNQIDTNPATFCAVSLALCATPSTHINQITARTHARTQGASMLSDGAILDHTAWTAHTRTRRCRCRRVFVFVVPGMNGRRKKIVSISRRRGTRKSRKLFLLDRGKTTATADGKRITSCNATMMMRVLAV